MLIRYTFQDANGEEWPDKAFNSRSEAKAYAQLYSLRLIEEVYEFSGSQMVEDYSHETHLDRARRSQERDNPSGLRFNKGSAA